MPFHVPSLTLSSWPSSAAPEITGSAVFDGASGATSAVCAEVAVLEPALLLAVTATRSVPPTSSWPSVYFVSVADGMLAHDSPALLHSVHW